MNAYSQGNNEKVIVPYGKSVKIVSKLNRNLCITISGGENFSKADQLIMVQDKILGRQRFELIQTSGYSQSYQIKSIQNGNVLSTKKWGNINYSSIIAENNDGDFNKIWRFVKFQEMVKDLSKQAMVQTKLEMKCKEKLIITERGTSMEYKLGYQFQSGPNIVAFRKLSPQQLSQREQVHRVFTQNIIPSQLGYSQQQSGNNEQKLGHSPELLNSIVKPFRTVVKQKMNLPEKDYHNEEWFFIQNDKYNLVLQVEGGIDQSGMNVVLNKNFGNRNQLWKFQF